MPLARSEADHGTRLLRFMTQCLLLYVRPGGRLATAKNRNRAGVFKAGAARGEALEDAHAAPTFHRRQTRRFQWKELTSCTSSAFPERRKPRRCGAWP